MNDTNTLQPISIRSAPVTQPQTLEERIAKLEATIKALEDRIVDLEELDLINSMSIRVLREHIQNVQYRMNNPNA